MTTALVLYDAAFAESQRRALVEQVEVVDGEHIRDPLGSDAPFVILGSRLRFVMADMMGVVRGYSRVSVSVPPSMGIKTGIPAREAFEQLSANTRSIDRGQRQIESGG